MAQAKAKGLGKGLGALFGDIPPVGSEPAVTTIPIEQIEPNPHQPRRDFPAEELQTLAESIAEHGVVTPLTVRKLEGEIYQIIAGERRWRAARMAKLRELPVYCIEADDRTVMELALIENLQRQDLNPVEEALGFQSLMQDFGLTQEVVATRVGRSRPAVANALRLLTLCEEVQALVRDGALSAGHARPMVTLPAAKQPEIAQQIIEKQLSVRQTEQLIKQLVQRWNNPPERVDDKDLFHVNYVAECEKQLSKKLGRGVKIVQGKRKGRCELEFYDLEDLDRLLDALENLDIKTK